MNKYCIIFFLYHFIIFFALLHILKFSFALNANIVKFLIDGEFLSCSLNLFFLVIAFVFI